MLGLALRSDARIAAVLANPIAVARLVVAVAAQIGFTYTVDRYRDCTRESDQINSPARVKWFLRHERFVVALLGASLVAGVWAVKDYADPAPWLVNFLFMGLYSFPFIFGYRVKDVPLLKTPYITVRRRRLPCCRPALTARTRRPPLPRPRRRRCARR